jgi:hypothetical protein
MIDSFKSRIIRKYPVGIKFDVFCNTFRQIYELEYYISYLQYLFRYLPRYHQA